MKKNIFLKIIITCVHAAHFAFADSGEIAANQLADFDVPVRMTSFCPDVPADIGPLIDTPGGPAKITSFRPNPYLETNIVSMKDSSSQEMPEKRRMTSFCITDFKTITTNNVSDLSALLATKKYKSLDNKLQQLIAQLKFNADRIVVFNELQEEFIYDLANIGYKLPDLVVSQGFITSKFESQKTEYIYHAPLYVNRHTGVESITIKQFKSIMSGNLKNWVELGGNDIEIEVLLHGGVLRRASGEALLQECGICLDKLKDLKAKRYLKSNKDLEEAASKSSGGIAFGLQNPKHSNLVEIEVDGQMAIVSNNYPLRQKVALNHIVSFLK